MKVLGRPERRLAQETLRQCRHIYACLGRVQAFRDFQT